MTGATSTLQDVQKGLHAWTPSLLKKHLPPDMHPWLLNQADLLLQKKLPSCAGCREAKVTSCPTCSCCAGSGRARCIVCCKAESLVWSKTLGLCWHRTYTVHWVTEKAGDYLITGWLEGCTVGGCAKACAVQPGPLDASHCSCAGEGLDRAVAGIPANFTVTACDRCACLPDLKVHSKWFADRSFTVTAARRYLNT